MTNPWKAGDRVRFAHQGKGFAYTVVDFVTTAGQTMLTLKELPGEFAVHLFIAADYPDDSIVPRPRS